MNRPATDEVAGARVPLLRPFQTRAIRIGVIASFMVLAAMALYPMLPGHLQIRDGPYAAVLVGGVVVSTGVAQAPWGWLFDRGWGQRALYLWSLLTISLVTWAVAITGHEQSGMFLLYAPIVVFYAGSYPVRGQLALSAVIVAAYALALHGGGPVDVNLLFFRLVGVVSVFFIASFLARELAQETRKHGHARSDAERRASLLAVVASAARAMQSHSAPDVLAAVADAVLALGFDAGGIAVEFPGDPVYRVVQARGDVPRGESWWPMAVVPGRPRGGVPVRYAAAPPGTAAAAEEAGQVWPASPPPVATPPGGAASDVDVADELPRRIAIPIHGRTAYPAVLLAGSHRRERLGDVDREALDLLASRAARALENAEHAAELERSERRLRSLVQNTSDLITVVDADGFITFQSASSRDVLGRPPTALLGRRLDALVHPDDAGALDMALRRAAGSDLHGSVELRLRDTTGGWRCIDTRINDLRDDPAVRGIVLNGRDVTEQHQLVEQLGYQARHDGLTRLPNRAQLQERLQEVLDADAARGRATGVLFIDLDDFKALNDLFGHRTGDALLLEIGRRFSDALPSGTTLARFGGDEFAAVLAGVESERAAAGAAERLLGSLQAPLSAGEAELYVGASVGIALGRDGEQDADELLRRADIAMYSAKTAGKGRAAVFDGAMEAALLARHELERDLRLAIERAEFELHFQPVVSLDTGGIDGVEALVRWRHPVRGLVPPVEFIPLAEETALIVPLGRLVLRESCRQLADWRARHPELARLRMSVNVSTLQLLDAGFPDDVADALAEFDLPASQVILEITEETLAEQQDTIAAALARLKRLGVLVAIDDFGTGYSSLGYLGTFPVDTLKIDRSFVGRLGAGDDAETLVGAVIDLAKRLRLSIIAEGIEQPSQVAFLRGLGCGLGQGFLFSRPYPADVVEPLLTNGLGQAMAA